MTLVKICGITRAEEVEMAARADLLGFVVLSPSRRSLDLVAAKDLMSIAAHPRVMVTTEADPLRVLSMADCLEPEVVQVHAMMTEAGLDHVSREYSGKVWGLVPVGGGDEVERLGSVRRSAHSALLDTLSLFLGGQGRVHDWGLSRRLRDEASPFPVMLAGGLGPGNVREAVRAVLPSGVDVSSGVEKNGSKDPGLIDEFIRRAKEEY